MKNNDTQIGRPAVLYKNTKANIEALAGLIGGETAYATDTGQDGVYSAVLSAWVWGRTSSSAPATTAANDFQVGDGSGNWIKKTLAQTITILRTSLDGIYQAVGSYVTDAASDNVYYGRRNAGWTNLKTYFDTLYAALSHAHAASDITSGTLATARLGSGTANANSYLSGDQTYKKIKFFLPFGVYTSINPLSATSYVYAATVGRSITQLDWMQWLYVMTTNDLSNYWIITIENMVTFAVIATISTQGLAANTNHLLNTTTFSPANLTATTQAVYVKCTKVGSPGVIYIACPMLECEMT